MAEKVAYPTVTPSRAKHLSTEVAARMQPAGVKGEVHTNEDRQFPSSPDDKNPGYRTIYEASDTGADEGALSEGGTGYASAVFGWQDRSMVDSSDPNRSRLPLECDVGRRGTGPDGKVAVGPSGPYEARVHRTRSADSTSSTSY